MSSEQKLAIKIHDIIIKEFSDIDYLPKVSKNWEKEVLDGKHHWFEKTHKRYFTLAVKTFRAIKDLFDIDILQIIDEKEKEKNDKEDKRID